jgi:ribosomal protein S18 acetylase RimI-like enzyme
MIHQIDTMSPLDNITWHALTTSQAPFAEGDGAARRFHTAIGPLAGMSAPTAEGFAALAQLIGPNEPAALFLREKVDPPPNFKVLRSIPLLQMLHDGTRPPAPKYEHTVLNPADAPEMIALARLTEPGPFEQRTIELGGYIGIKQNGQLASMAGERLRIPGYTEISAVCTHPDHLGHGYAASLMTEIIHRLLDRGDVPFLHSRHDNDRAIAIYERLGFRKHAMLHLLVIAKDN